jgi:prolipoprotein diacylglyceryltransferase
MLASGLERFITEFWRNTPKIAFGWMSLAQMLSIVLILFGAGMINWAANRPEESKARRAAPSHVKGR